MAAYGYRQPLSQSYFSVDGAIRSSRGIQGDAGVYYDEGGRLVYPGQQPDAAQGLNNRLLWRGGDPSQFATPNNFRYRPWNRTVVADPSAGPIFPRRVDGVQAVPTGRPFYQPPVIEELPYAPAGRLAGLPVTSIGAAGAPVATTTALTSRTVTTTMLPETIVIEEMRVYDDKPCCFWLHLVVGILMIAVGVANVIICFDHLYFCFLWTGIAIVIFAIVCWIHGGDYVKKTWKSKLLIIVGFVTTAFEMACVWLVVVTFCYHLISLIEVGSTDYVTTWKFRYAYYNMTPLVTVNNDYTYNLFSCFALNAFQIALLLASFVVLSTTLIVVDRFYNSHYVIHRKVEPNCDPWLFNPWGQSSLGQVMILIGSIVGATEHGNEIKSWFLLYSPVWAGIFPILAGVAAALSLKTCDKNRKWEHWLAVGLEVLSLVASVVAIILMLLALTDNVVSLNSSAGAINGCVLKQHSERSGCTFSGISSLSSEKTTQIAQYTVAGRMQFEREIKEKVGELPKDPQTGVMLNTSWDKTLLTVSVIAKGFAIIIAGVNVFYSATLIFRILTCICSNLYKNIDEPEEKRYVLEDNQIQVEKPEQRLVQQREAMATTAATTYNTNANANLPFFSAYRPMGTRSFYT